MAEAEVLGIPLIWELGGGAIAGMAVGYAIKKTTRLLLLAVGLGILILYALMQAGFVTVNWDAMGLGLENGTRTLAGWLWNACKELSVTMVGFGAGLLVGLKMK